MQFFSIKAIRTRDNLHKRKKPRLEMTGEENRALNYNPENKLRGGRE